MQMLVTALLIATVIPILLAMSTIPLRIKQFGKPDLENPRHQASLLTGVGLRLVNAQANAWEALAMFVAAILAATLMGVEAHNLQTPIYLFLGARVSHAIFYAVNMPPLRFLAFSAAFGSCMWIFAKALG